MSTAAIPSCVIGRPQRRGSLAISQEYPAIRMPMRNPAASRTYGRLSAPRSEMNFERVIGLMALYDVIARNEYANIISAVAVSPSRISAMGDSNRRAIDMGRPRGVG